MNRIKELRKEKNLTLRELASDLNMSYSNIGYLERGKSMLREDTAKMFADYFKVSSDYLLGLTDERTPSSTSTNDVTLAFYNQHGIVTDEQKKEVEAFIEFIKSKK